MGKFLVVLLLVVILFACVIGDVLPRLSDKAMAGNDKAVFQVVSGVIIVLFGWGAVLILITTKLGGG